MTLKPPVCQRDFEYDDLRKHGCVLASLAWVRRWAGNDSGRESRVDDYRRASGVSMSDFRRRGVMLGEAAHAHLTLDYPGDRLAPNARKVIGGSVERDILPDLEDGAVALMWVAYDVVQDAGIGYGSWRKGHAVVYAGVDDGIVVADPLRRQLVTWPRDVAIRAAERFGKKKRINALIVRPSRTHTQEIARYRDLMYRARGQRDAFKARVAELEAQGGCTPEALAAARIGGIEAMRAAVAKAMAGVE